MTRTERQEQVLPNGWYSDFAQPQTNASAVPTPKTQLTEAEQNRRLAGELDHALHSAEKIHRSLQTATDYFYAGRQTEAVRVLTHCLEGLARFLETISHTRPLLGEKFEQQQDNGRKLSDIEREFIVILASLSHSQEQMDFDSVVEKVEDELLTNLSAWISSLRALCRTFG